MNDQDQFSFMDKPNQPVPSPGQLGSEAYAFMDEGGGYSLKEYATQYGSSFLQGLTGAFTGAVEGLGILSEKLTGESQLDDRAREMQASVQQFAPGVTGLGQGWTAGIGGAFGSATGFVLAGAATGGTGALAGRGLAGVGALGRAAGASAEAIGAAGAAVGRGVQMATAGGIGALGNAAARYEEAKALGKSEDEAWGSYLAGAAIGSLEIVPVGLARSAQRLGRINNRTGGALSKLTVGQVMLAEGLEEAGQEALNESLNQLADYAMGIKSAEEAFEFGEVLKSGVLGFLPGSAISGLTAKAQIAADLAEQRKALAEKEAAELPKKLEEQRIQGLTEQVEGATKQAEQLNQLYEMGQKELERLKGPAEVAEGETPRPVGTPEQIAQLEKQLEQIGEAREISAKQLEAVAAETELSAKAELAGDYGYARAAAERKGLLEEFEKSQEPGAERLMVPEEEAKWAATKEQWKKTKAFGALPINVDTIRPVLPASDSQRNAERILNEAGVDVEFLDLGAGSEAVQGFQQGNKVYLNSRLSEGQLLRTVARHEGYHSLYRKSPEEWQATLNKMQQVAPNVFNAAMNKAASEISTRLGLDEAKLRKRLQTPEGRAELTNETMSSMADIFSSTIDALRENPSLADELIQKDPGFFRKIWEWVKERLNKIGFDFNTLSAEEQKALGKLPKLLYKTTDGEVEVEASVNERIAGANTLIALWDRAQAGTEVAMSSRQRQARIFAKRTLATIEATKKTEAKVKEDIDAEDAEAAAKRKEAEEKEQARVAKKREAEITKVVNKIKQISETEESWYLVEAAGTATTIEDRNTAVQMLPFGLKDATAEETNRLGQALVARYDKYAARAKAAAERKAEQKQKEADQKTRAAEELAARQAEAQRKREAAELAKQQREEAAKAKQAEREFEQERKALQRQREKEQAAEERRRNAKERRNAAAERLAAKQVEKERKEAEKQQRKADAAAAKLAEQQRREREAAEAAEAAAQVAEQQEQEEKEARTRRKGERIPKLRRGYIAPGQLRVGDIVSYNYWKAKVIEATGSGLEQRVKLQRLSDAEAKMIDTMDRQDWWNAVPFAGRVFTVNMTSSKIISLVASRSEEEVLEEDGVKMLRERLRADLERREGDPPRFSIVGQYDDMAVDMRYSKALGLMEAFKAGGEIPATSTWDAIHDYKSRGFDRDEWNQAIKYFEEYGMWPYLSAGQYTIPVQIDTQVEPLFSINLGKKEQAIHEPTGLPLNKNGTVTVYYPTTNDNARRLIETRELVGHSVDAKRIYLTNESSGAAIAKKPGTIEQPTDGANVLLHIDPNLLSLDAEYEGGRKDFYITIREGEAFDQKMKQVKLFTLDIDRDKPVSPPLTLDKLNEAVADAVAAYRALKPEQRKERLREAKKRLKAKHNVGVLLSQPNAKLRKTSDEMGPRTKNGKRVSSLGLGLASAQKLGDKLNLCANSANCRDTCLGDKSGLNALYGGEGSSRSGPRLSQYLKTEALVLSTEDFAVALYAEIEKFERAVLRERRQPSVRLNQTSDLPPSVLKPFIEAFPRTIFYDYTKLHSSSIAPNHHLTYSSTGWSQMIDGEYQESKGTNWGRMRNMLDSGFNVAISFTGRGKTSLPDFILDEQTGIKYKVIDGDTYDARFLDQQPEGQPGIVIGLRNKDDTRAAGKEPLLEELKAKGRSLFVYYDRQVHGPTLGVPPQKASEETIARLKERMKAAPPAQAEAELEGEQETPSFSVLGRVTPEMDAEYMAAVESGDMVTAQRMVDEAARAAGYAIGPVYHAGRKKFNRFMSLSEQAEEAGESYEPEGYDGGNLGIGFYFTPDKAYASKYGKARKFYLKIDKLLDFADEQNKNRFGELLDEMTEDLGEVAQGEVIDALVDETNSTGVVGYGVGGMSGGATEYMVRSSNQAKLADAVALDDAGAVIPLSQRFQDTTDDVRFSVRGKIPAAVGFAGGGTFEIALSDVLDTQLAVEMQPDIAEAYNRNAQRPATVAKIGDVDAEDFKGKVLAHFSPPCVDSSLLRSGQGVDKTEETERGREVANIIRVAQNPIVVIENVKEYANSEAYKLITDALTESGYTWDAHVYKAQDYGSPSKRQRLFVRAVKEGELPPRPEPTHSNKPTLFEAPYASWGDALADVIDTLPEFKGELPPYVLKTLEAANINPKAPNKAYYISGSQVHGRAPLSPSDKPAPSVVASGAETPRILMPDGRVLRVTPEAMKRLMGFGAEMQLPSDPKLAKRIVGNGIPKPLTRAVVLPLLESQGVLDTQGPMFSAKGKGGKGKKGKPKRVSGKAAREAVKASRSAAAQLAAAQERVRKERAKELPGIKVAAELAYKGGEGTDIGEAPGTAIASDTEEGRALIRALREQARAIDTQVLPDLTADDDARSKAVAELANDYEGVKAALYKEIDNTGAVSEPWKVYATMLIAAQEAEKAMSGRMTVAKYMAAYEAEQRDSIVKRAASASLRVRKDAVMSAAARNRAHIFAGTKAMRKEVNKLRKAAEGGNKEKREKAERKIAKMRAAHAKAVVEAIDGMSEEGYDVDGLFSYLSGGDPVTFSRIVKRLADARTLSDMREGYASTYWDAVMEARMASLLSGPATHTANIVGNAAMVTLRTTRQLAEVLTNTVIRDPDSADFGDFKAYMTGFLRSLGRAGRNLMMAYRTDMPVFEVQLSRDTALEFAEKTDAIPGLIGRMLRLPSLTTLRAFDEFFKTVAAHTEVASLAYRDGRSRGMSGEALENHIDRVLNDFNDPLWQEGLDEALKTVFQDKSDRLTQLLLSTRSFLDDNPTTVPIGSFLLPFVKTPLQIFKVGLSMPIHPIIPIFRWVNRKRAGEEYTGKEKAMDSANALVSMALFVAAYSMLGDDDDDESRVTGAAPDQWEERMLGQRTAPAYSIKSSDGDWYTYGRIEPFATGFSAMVDGLRAQQRIMRDDVPDKWSQGMSIMFNNVFGQIEDKTFLRTVGDIAKMFRQRDQINAAKFAKDLFVTPMIPNLIRQTVGNTDPYIRNTTVREYEDKSTWESAMQSVGYAAYPDPSREGAPPMRYDLWGRPIKRPGDSAFARNFSPAQKVYDEDDVHKLDRLIVNFNDKVADGKFGESVEKYLPRSPEYRLKRGDQSYILNDEEYARYSKESGERAARMLSRTRLNYDDPTQRDIDKIRDTLARSRKLVVDRILRERRKAAN